MQHQILVIHGGDTFRSYEEYLSFLKGWQIDFERLRSKQKGWKENLQAALGYSFEVIAPRMPNNMNAKYSEWKIWFEKYVPHLEKETTLIGHSLGGIFLVKYLSENEFPKRIQGLFLVAAPHDDKHSQYSLADFALPERLTQCSDQADTIFIYHSTDDPVVPFADYEAYQQQFPKATARKFTDRKHFDQEEFPELIEDIKSLYA